MTNLSPNMLSYLAYAIDDPFPISQGHFSTISALYSRGAVDFVRKKHWSDNNMHYLVTATPAGKQLYEWATKSKHVDWKDACAATRTVRKGEYNS